MTVNTPLPVLLHHIHWYDNGNVYIQVSLMILKVISQFCLLELLQVESSLYKLHRSILINVSNLFKDLFEVPRTENPDGYSQDNPIILQQVEAKIFDMMLQSAYGR
jgi:hypothetical protein